MIDYTGYSVARCAIGWVVYRNGAPCGRIVLSRWGKNVVLWNWHDTGLWNARAADFVTGVA